MAQTQKTIRFNKNSDRIVKTVSPMHEENYNYAVNQIMHRYALLCKHLQPKFEQNEFHAICQAYNGHFFNADVELEARAFPWQIKKAIQYDENVRCLLDGGAQIGNPLRTDFPEFIAKIDALTIPQIIALFQAVHEFWSPKNLLDTSEDTDPSPDGDID